MEEKERIGNIGGLSVRLFNVVMIVLMAIVIAFLLHGVQQTNATYDALSEAADSYMVCETAANDMKEGSNYLTAQIRQFVITHDMKYLDSYFEEALQTQRRDKAVEILESYAKDKPAHVYLEQSRVESNELMYDEEYAAQLVLSATDATPNLGAEELATVSLSAEDAALSSEEKLAKAMTMVFGDGYQEHVDAIENDIALCKTSLIDDLQTEQQSNSEALDGLLMRQQLLTSALLILAILLIIATIVFILWPIREYIRRIEQNRSLPLTGAHELRILAKEYNELYEKNLKHSDDLRRRAEHDHLTGLYNRAAFDGLLQAYRKDEIALLFIDADRFKEVNDTYGHDMGDRVLKKLADLLTATFRSTDFPCRIGGDEFAVIMTDITPSLKSVIETKIGALIAGMADDSDGVPATNLSIGIAFNEGVNEAQTMIKHADEALYRVKNAGRNGYQFF